MFIIGIDLGNEYSQVCYYNFNTSEPESVVLSSSETQFKVQTAVLKDKNRENGWLAGDVAVSGSTLGEGVLFDKLIDKAKQKDDIIIDDIEVSPVELLSVYFLYLLQYVTRAFGKDEKPDKICITINKFDVDVITAIEEAFAAIGYSKNIIEIISNTEAFVFYAISQEPSLWKMDNAMFEYTKEGLKYYQMLVLNDMGKRIVTTRITDYNGEIFGSGDADSIEDKLMEIAGDELSKRSVSTIYLTGEGFEGEFSFDRFISLICNRRRVFAGQNLYVKGACYCGYESLVGPKKDIIVGCHERITTGIEMKINDRGVDKILRMVKPGVNWHNASCSYDFIIDNCDKLEFFLSPVLRKEKKRFEVSIGSFPIRENKASRITVSISFSSDRNARLSIYDRGFGEFVKSSNKVINEDILL